MARIRHTIFADIHTFHARMLSETGYAVDRYKSMGDHIEPVKRHTIHMVVDDQVVLDERTEEVADLIEAYLNHPLYQEYITKYGTPDYDGFILINTFGEEAVTVRNHDNANQIVGNYQTSLLINESLTLEEEEIPVITFTPEEQIDLFVTVHSIVNTDPTMTATQIKYRHNHDVAVIDLENPPPKEAPSVGMSM